MIGVDEVGRGCLAGPLLVVAARATSRLPKGLKDSKLMSRRQREKILDLLSISCAFGEGWVSAKEIDLYGLSRALRLGAVRALRSITATVDEVIILDGKFNYLPKKYKLSRCLVNADTQVGLVSAASVYAKVSRDRYMGNLKKLYPNYGFESHVGYGTLAHRKVIEIYGPIQNLHRLSFKPLRRT